MPHCSIHQRRSIEMSCTNDTESPTRSTKNTEPSSHWAIVYLGIGKSNKEEYHILNRATGTYLTTTCEPSQPLETQTASEHMLKQTHSGRQRPGRRHLQPEEPSGQRRALEHRPRVQQARTVWTVLVSSGTQKRSSLYEDAWGRRNRQALLPLNHSTNPVISLAASSPSRTPSSASPSAAP
jgi:hypothetical protein